MSSKKLSAGDIVESQCTRCRAVMNHTIVAMVEERVVRVQCNTCNGVHNYKEKKTAKVPAAKTAAARKAPAAGRSRKDPKAAERQEWEELRPNLQGERALGYRMDGKYKVKDLLNHPVFGLGVVVGTAPNKIEVLFQDGKKLLRCQ